MKKIKFIIALAMVFATLSFGFKAHAQNVPVTVTSLSGSYPPFAASVTYYVTLVDNSTSEEYHFQTSSSNLSDGVYHIGSVPPGSYSVSIAFSDPNFYQSYFDWNVFTDEGYSLSMYANTDYQLTTNTTVTTSDELTIVMYRI